MTRHLRQSLGWLLVVVCGPAAHCPAAAPPGAFPLPVSADPPRAHEVRVAAHAGVGGGLEKTTDGKRKDSIIGGGALRVSYAPAPGMIVGMELGGGARHSTEPDSLQPQEKPSEWSLSSRLVVGYGGWLWDRRLSMAAEIGLTTGLHSDNGGYVGPDATLALSIGGRRWWALTAAYRLAYVVPSRQELWAGGLYHLAAVSVMVPRKATYAFYVQLGTLFGHLFGTKGDPLEDSNAMGVVGVIGFRFSYGL